MLSREDILRVGAKELLKENEKEREMLLKLLGEQPSAVASSGIKKLVRRNIKPKAKKWSKAQREKFAATMKAKFGHAS